MECLIRNQIGYGSELAVVMVRVDLLEERFAQGHKFLGRVLVEEAEKGERSSEIVHNRSPTKQRRPLRRNRDTTSDSVTVAHAAEMQPVIEQLDQRERVALIGALRSEAGSSGLRSADVAWPIGDP